MPTPAGTLTCVARDGRWTSGRSLLALGLQGARTPPSAVSRCNCWSAASTVTVNPLTNPEGGVRGGLLVLEDISQEKRMKSTLYRYMTPGVAERVMALGMTC
jgi:uncharacterized protein YbaP (TraB family)